jgi:hypothetical protein
MFRSFSASLPRWETPRNVGRIFDRQSRSGPRVRVEVRDMRLKMGWTKCPYEF